MFIKGNLREYTRTPFVKTLRYSVSMKKLNDTAVSVDISTGGLGMIACYPLEPGHVLIFEDEITNIKTKSAVVKWIRKINNGEYRIGLNFL